MTSVELCIKMLQYSVFAEITQERRPSEVKEALKFFFTDEEIKRASDFICGRSLCP
jgi:hypothetical protein